MRLPCGQVCKIAYRLTQYHQHDRDEEEKKQRLSIHCTLLTFSLSDHSAWEFSRNRCTYVVFSSRDWLKTRQTMPETRKKSGSHNSRSITMHWKKCTHKGDFVSKCAAIQSHFYTRLAVWSQLKENCLNGRGYVGNFAVWRKWRRKCVKKVSRRDFNYMLWEIVGKHTAGLLIF